MESKKESLRSDIFVTEKTSEKLNAINKIIESAISGRGDSRMLGSVGEAFKN